MAKIFFTLLLLAGTTFCCFAQTEGQVSIAVDAGIPIGESGDIYSSAIGGSLKFETLASESVLFTLSVGYASLAAKKALIGGGSIKPPAAVFAPVKLGLKYRLAGLLYAEGQIGAAFETRPRRSTRFIYAPGLVCSFGHIDAGLRYEGWVGGNGNINQMALRLGV